MTEHIRMTLSPAERANALGQTAWDWLLQANVVDPHRIRPDLMTWRRGSAQMALRINAELHNFSIYSALVSGVRPSEALYKYLLAYNSLQRLESLGLQEHDARWYIVLKYTMELELVSREVLQHHVFCLQERADVLDTELARRFGGSLRFEDWKKLDQKSVDNMIDALFG
jgi:hypothetical protein